ncbi:MAG: dTDP-4-dehydrorhamnose 3,5-epimerase [Alphaproteobacteria bacterium]|nr:dTDP-4-dehydrorhamnose 3,5-epimerase [Alphaproteobacteria bacterium]
MVHIEPTEILDVKLISAKKFGDDRGFFSETYNFEKLSVGGINVNFCQDNHSFSRQIGTLRGLHFQTIPLAQDKLVRVTKGAIYDVAVDIRKGSPTYGQWVARVISAELWNQILVPKGFAHGFCTIERNTEVQYKVSAPYSLENERGIAWDDPELAIKWPLGSNNPILSEKDKKYPKLCELPDYFSY